MTKGILFTSILMMTSACGGSSTDAPAGTPTATPSDMKVASGTTCIKTDSGIGTTVVLNYEHDLLDSGDLYVACSVSGTTYQSSNSHLYKAGASGVSTGACSVIYDIDTASSGGWYFQNPSATFRTVYYLDATSTHNNYQYTFTAGDCTNY